MDVKRSIIFAVVAVAAAAAALAAAYALLARGGTGGAEDGGFANDCCGTVRLEGGSLVLNDRQRVQSALGRDPAGASLLPVYYVGAVEDYGLEMDGTRPPL